MAPWVRWGLAGTIALGAVLGLQLQLDRMPSREVEVNMLFVPNAALTQHAASGFENLVADGLWLDLLQYYGGHLGLENWHMKNLGPMFGLITDLDPHFWFAYWLGAWALGDNHQADTAIAILKKGEARNPNDYNYPYLEGFIHFLDRHDYTDAATCFLRAAALPGAPRFARSMAARMVETEGKEQLALQLWQGIYSNAADAATKAIAKRNVQRVEAEIAGKRPPTFKPD
ncbi:MAG TPA: hypothetical protein V6D47_13670 [Oscillatoriaceae cyanobacterium]